MKKLIVLFFVPFFVQKGQAQFRTLTSANGEGRVLTPVFSQNRFAGQLSAAYSNSLVNNFQNPASYADATLTTIEVGALGLSGSYSLSDTTKSSGGMGISHFSMILPLTVGKSGLGIGITHHANTNYSILGSGSHPDFGAFKIQNTGTGNIYEAFIGLGVNIKSLKIGGTIATQFGRNDYVQDIIYPDTVYLPTLRTRNAYTQLGMQFTLGTQYEVSFDKKRHGIFGAYYTRTLFKNGSEDFSKQNIFNLGYSGKDYIKVVDTNFSTSLPNYSKFGIGFSLVNNKSLLIGTEFNYENYSEFTERFTGKNLQNAWHIHIGGEYRPFMNRENDSRKYFNRVTYRFGGIIGKSEQNYEGSLNELKVMGGATFPILGRNIGYLTLGAEYGARGFGGTNQITENLFSFHLILTFADKWFMRQKFD